MARGLFRHPPQPTQRQIQLVIGSAAADLAIDYIVKNERQVDLAINYVISGLVYSQVDGDLTFDYSISPSATTVGKSLTFSARVTKATKRRQVGANLRFKYAVQRNTKVGANLQINWVTLPATSTAGVDFNFDGEVQVNGLVGIDEDFDAEIALPTPRIDLIINATVSLSTPSAALTIDAIVRALAHADFTADAAEESIAASQFTIDPVTRSLAHSDFAADAAIRSLADVDLTIDAVEESIRFSQFTIDPSIRQLVQVDLALDAVVRNTATSDFVVDAAEENTVASQFTLDAIIVNHIDVDLVIDAGINETVGSDFDFTSSVEVRSNARGDGVGRSRSRTHIPLWPRPLDEPPEPKQRVPHPVAATYTFDAPISSLARSSLVIDAAVSQQVSAAFTMARPIRQLTAAKYNLDFAIYDFYDWNQDVLLSEIDPDLVSV